MTIGSALRALRKTRQSANELEDRALAAAQQDNELAAAEYFARADSYHAKASEWKRTFRRLIGRQRRRILKGGVD